jgi:DNA processing protein
VRGDATALTRLRPSVALVGARAASSYGDHVAMELAADLAGGGIPVVSGGAYGIDGAAHRAALAAGGLTIALLAGGAERAYPAGHTRLIDDVAATGAVVSEVPCGTAPTKWRFLQRNRLIAAIADATVVVEAGWRSGSLNTAGHAAALSRQLGAVPGQITSATSAGAHRLLREFGAACITGAQDVREMLGMTGGSCAPPVSTTSRGTGMDPRTDDTTRVRDALSTRAWRDASDIARRAGMTPVDTEGVLGLLHLEGSAERASAGWRLTSNAR